MSRQLLQDLIRHADQLIDAGADAAVGSEKLHALIGPLDRLAAAVPAVGPIARHLEKLRDATPAAAPTLFLDLLGMTRQVRQMLFASDCPHELREMPEDALEWDTPLSRKQFEESRDLLQGRGPDRRSHIRSLIETGRIVDLRLVEPMLELLDESGPVCDLIVHEALPLFGKTIAPDLARRIDIHDGGSPTNRKLSLLADLDGPLTLEVVRQILAGGHANLKPTALELLPRLTQGEEIERIALPLLGDPSRTLRIAAIDALAGAVSVEARDRLWHLFDTAEKATRESAGNALGNMKADHVVPFLAKHLRDQVGQFAALKAEIAAAKPVAARKLVTQLSPVAETVVDLLQVLRMRPELPTKLVREILPLMDSPRADIRATAIRLAGKHGTSIADLPDRLAALTQSDVAVSIRAAAIEAIASMTPAKRAGILDRLFNQARSLPVADPLYLLLVRVGGDHLATHEAEFRALLSDGFKRLMRWESTEAMIAAAGRLGTSARDMLPGLLEGMKDCPYDSKDKALGLMGAFPKIDPDGSRVFRWAEEHLTSWADRYGKAAALVLAGYGKQAEPLKPKLQGLLNSGNGSATRVAEWVLKGVE